MIALTITAVLNTPPVVTTPDSIDQRKVSAILGPVVAHILEYTEGLTGIAPIGAQLTIQWADGTDTVEEPKDKPVQRSPVPKWMS